MDVINAIDFKIVSHIYDIDGMINAKNNMRLSRDRTFELMRNQMFSGFDAVYQNDIMKLTGEMNILRKLICHTHKTISQCKKIQRRYAEIILLEKTCDLPSDLKCIVSEYL
jgi:predicted RNase H-like nuclease